MCTGKHPFIPVPNTARVRMVYSLYGQVVMNVFYWRGDAPFIASDLASIVNEVHIAWVANFKSHQPSQLVLQYIEATALDTEPGFQVTQLYNEAGTGSSAALPGGTTVAIKFGSGVTGRSARGRMYWLQLDTGGISGDQLSTGAISMLGTIIPAFFGAIETALGHVHVIVSYCTGKAWRTTGATEEVLSYGLVDNNVDSQRRRLAGRGM